MNLKEALKQYQAEQLEKFRARDEKNGERSVTRVGARYLNEPGIRLGMLHHLNEEVRELIDADLNDSREAVDVGNMAFLIWWSIKEAVLTKQSSEAPHVT